MSNPDTAKAGQATQFGTGLEQRENAAKSNPWSIRNMVRHFAAIDTNRP
jgi:hypothetical protein